MANMKQRSVPRAPSLSEIDFRLIKVFVAVVNNRGFSAAQAELGMVTSTISNHIATLEHRLRSRLCQRGRGGFILTPEGHVVYEAAQILLRGVENFKTHVDSLRGSLAGTLRIGAIDTGISNPNSPLLGAIQTYNKRPNVTRLTITLDDIGSLERMILGGQIDVAIMCVPRKIDGINYTYLFDELLTLYCSNNHNLFDIPDNNISNDLLSQQRIVSRELWSGIEAEKFMSKRADAIINHIDAKIRLILTGTYIGFIPTPYATPWVESGMIRSIRPSDFNWTTSYYVMIKKGAEPSRQLRIFLRDILSITRETAPDKRQFDIV